jgi:hypothetical protein
VRASELAFTVAEARELLVERGQIELEQDEIEVLAGRTEGWPARSFWPGSGFAASTPRVGPCASSESISALSPST